MAPPQFRDLREDEILQRLNESDYGEEDLDYIDDATDDEYVPNNENQSSDSSSDDNMQPQPSRTDIRTVNSRGRTSRGRNSRGRSCRGRSTRGGSSTSRQLVAHTEQTHTEWQIKNFSPLTLHLSEPSYLPIDSTEYDREQYLEQYIDDELVQLIVDKSNQMYIYRTGKSLELTTKEFKIYMAVTMLMSCVCYPYIRQYWEMKWRLPLIADAISRNRYFQLRTSLKLVFDPDITEAEKARDKLWKVRPIIKRVLKGCHKQVKDQHVAVDEMMIPFSGSCGMKQYCPNKPNPVGLKAFVLANPDGTVCDFNVYQGETTFPEEKDAGFSLGESAVLNLTRTLVPGHIIYFDRYFTSVKLAQELFNRGHQCAGTIMRNRIPNSLKAVLPDDHEMKRRGRGSSSVFVNSSDSIAFTKWFDNKPVLLVSTAFGSEPVDECRRWCKTERRYINIERPMVVKMYNSKMGGVDLADRMLAVCPSRARTNKWTIRFLSHMVDLSVSNSWIQYRKAELKLGRPLKKIQSLRQWKMELAENILDKNTSMGHEAIEETDGEDEVEPIRKRGRPGTVPLPSKIRRVQGQHLPIFVGVVNRCRQPGCSNKTTAKCSTCNVALCLTAKRNCYKQFHE